jgi:hypothetical protein
MATMNALAWVQRVRWTARQTVRSLSRYWGRVGIAFLLLTVLVLGAGLWLQSQHKRLVVLRAHTVVSAKLPELKLPMILDVAQGLDDFQRYLLPHEDIPDALRDLITLAQRQQLTLARGEYKSQVDLRGQFLRYQMTLPVQGDAQAIERFILAALAQHKTLALESVQFKRERIESKDLEAKIQWTLLTKLPSLGAKP